MRIFLFYVEDDRPYKGVEPHDRFLQNVGIFFKKKDEGRSVKKTIPMMVSREDSLCYNLYLF